MIIDFHAHTFPDALAPRAIHKLAGSEGLSPFSSGTDAGLIDSMMRAGIDYSVTLPIATKSSQTDGINKRAIMMNEKADKTHIFSFGTVHPDNENYREILDNLVAGKVRGIKLHPVFQLTNIDDDRYLRIIDYANEKGLIISLHAGRDITYYDATFGAPERIRNVVKAIHPERMILAHMGSWGLWDEAEILYEYDELYFDTSFVLARDNSPFFFKTAVNGLHSAELVGKIKQIGSKRILYGSDSPWTDQSRSIEDILRLDISQNEKEDILGGNAACLLGLT